MAALELLARAAGAQGVSGNVLEARVGVPGPAAAAAAESTPLDVRGDILIESGRSDFGIDTSSGAPNKEREFPVK